MQSIQFLTNEASKVEGLAYAGFETFRGSPYTSCARETGQNSRDAGRATPVRVAFKLHHIERARIPFADALAHSIGCCLDDPQDEKTRVHLERALEAISAPSLKVLEIADYNTSGLIGPTDDPHSVFAALVKGDGVTNKANDTSAGSFGIGKNAAYAVSDLQMVVYSTVYEDKETEEERFAAQGRLRLISHVDGDRKCAAEGYWGNPVFTAVEDPSSLPDWLSRQEIGTTIFSLGFSERKDWAGQMTLSLVTNFFVAIDREEIEFSVEDATISRTSLDAVLVDQALEAIAVENDQLAELRRARRLLLATRSEAASRHTISIAGLGDFTLHLLVGEGLPREVHILRNGIYITDNFAKFSQPLRQFPGTREFIAVVEPASSAQGKAPSVLLKRLENPAHDAFEPDRLSDEAERDQAKKQIKKLVAEMRKIIRSEAKIDVSERSQLDELSELFADIETSPSASGEGENDPDRFTYIQPEPARRRRPPGAGGTGKGDQAGGSSGTRPSARTGQSRRTGARNGARAGFPLESIRSTVGEAGPYHRTLHFTPGADGQVVLAVEAAGLTDDVELAVLAADKGEVVNGRARVPVTAGERTTVRLVLAEPFEGPIELRGVQFNPAAEASEV